MVQACGVNHVEIIDPYDVESSISAFERASEHEGVSVVIARHPCVMIEKGTGNRCAVDSCTGCKKCLTLGCPAIEFHDGKARINMLCTGCGVCAQICPFDAIHEIPTERD
ncbi:MAG: 4Fe-4S binding protein [Methermicoccaceae archaeon]